MAQIQKDNSAYYQIELSLLYKERLILQSAIFDDDNFIHGLNCKCCNHCLDDPCKYAKESNNYV